jgi:hypothetical protein
MTGATRSNPPGGMFDKNTFRCLGMNASFDGKTTGSTVYEAIDADGDKRLQERFRTAIIKPARIS